jgi:16S rRNA processing protein RimM
VGLVRIGKVVRAIGLGGYVGVAGSEGALAELETVMLQRGGEPERRRVVEARRQGRLWAVRLEGVEGRTAAEALVGSEVLAERGELGEAGEGRHFWADLEGLAVVTVGGAAVGRVTDLLATGAVDVLVVTGEGGREALIPLAPYVTVDYAAGRVVVDPPEGLLDLEAKDDEETEEGGGPPRGG